MIFRNVAPEDKEWTAHISLLNKWTQPERYLRDIVQYARSGPFYPANMHVNLIEQVIENRLKSELKTVNPIDPQSYLRKRIDELDKSIISMETAE